MRLRNISIRLLSYSLVWTLINAESSLSDEAVEIVSPATVQNRESMKEQATIQESQALQLTHSLGEIRATLSVSSDSMPENLAEQNFAAEGVYYHSTGTSRSWEVLPYQWHSPAFRHGPVYFQQVALERYGASCGRLQPVLSGVRFYASAALWPVLTLDELRRPPASNVGFERPGSPICR